MTNRYTGLSGDEILDEEIKECREIISNPSLGPIHAEAMGSLGMLLMYKKQREARVEKSND